MAKDAKVVQRGVNVQGNDLALSAGSQQHAINIDYFRDGVAARRKGFESFWDGLPQRALDSAKRSGSLNISGGGLSAGTIGSQRGFWELFSRDRLFCLSHGMIFTYVDDLIPTPYGYAKGWQSIASYVSHQYRFHGTVYESSSIDIHCWFLGKLVGSSGSVDASSTGSPFSVTDAYLRLSGSSGGVVGAVTNSTAQAVSTVGATLNKFYEPFDVVGVSNASGSRAISDNTSIRDEDGALIAGSITAPGSADGTGSAAQFDGASWMASDGNDTVWIADNTNEIRKLVISTTVVTTFAGSTTAGDSDGVGTAASFRTISGLAYDGSQFLYVSESGGHRIRKVDVSSGSVTIFAGALTPTSGYVDGTGTAARFDTPVGIEYVDGYLYVGDSGNNVVREIDVATAAVITYAGRGSTTSNSDGIFGGEALYSAIPGVVVRGQYKGRVSDYGEFSTDGRYIVIECTATESETMDVALLDVVSQGTAAASNTHRYVYPFARCPNSFADPVSGPLKLDTAGPNAYSYAYTRGADVGRGCVFTTREFPRELTDNFPAVTILSGMPKLRPIGIDAPEAPSCTTVGSGSTFANGTAWAYRSVCGLNLPDGRTIFGPPSERIIVTNSSGGTVDGSVTAYPSAGLPYDGMAFVQLYRTKTASSSATDPGDQMFLAYETPLTYGNGVVISDVTPDDNLGAELYTNATQPGGFGSASLRPPLWANDVAAFNKSLVFSNYLERASIRFKVVGTSPLTAGSSSISIETYGRSVTFVATASASSPALREFQIASGGSAAQNAAQTARNIAYCINRSPDAYMFTAVYDEEDPGAVIVTSLFPGLCAENTNNTINSGVATTYSSIAPFGRDLQSYVSFDTNAPTAFFTTDKFDSYRQLNGLRYSDQNDIDSFPVGNTDTCGPDTESIVRILPISERLIVVKDDSVWATDQSFTPQIYDTALSCSLPDSFARVNNQWIGLFTRGFVALNATQATAIGRMVERDVNNEYNNFIVDFELDFASAAAIDLSGNYVCTFNKRTFVYNVITRAWSEWVINTNTPQTDGVEVISYPTQRTSGMLWVGAYKDRFVTCIDAPRGVYQQKDYRADSTNWLEDYADMTWSFTATLAADLTTMTVADYSIDATSNPGAYPPFEWTPPQGATVAASMASVTSTWMLAVTQGGTTLYAQGTVSPTTAGSATTDLTITALSALDLTAGSVTVACYAPILCSVQWAPTFVPGVNANFNDTLITLERTQPSFLVARYFNRYDIGSATVPTAGLYTDSNGVCRAMSMTALASGFDPADQVIAYNSVVRSETPSERAYDQQMAIELWESTAWQVLSFKSVVIDNRSTDTAKVNQ